MIHQSGRGRDFNECTGLAVLRYSKNNVILRLLSVTKWVELFYAD